MAMTVELKQNGAQSATYYMRNDAGVTAGVLDFSGLHSGKLKDFLTTDYNNLAEIMMAFAEAGGDLGITSSSGTSSATVSLNANEVSGKYRPSIYVQSVDIAELYPVAVRISVAYSASE